MAQLFFDPKGAAVTIDAADAGQARAANLRTTRTTTTYKEWDDVNCLEIESAQKVVALSGELTLELLSAADIAVMATALFGGDITASSFSIGSAEMAEHAITVVVTNAADDCAVTTYVFPRCQLADDQDHIFGVPSDTVDPTPQVIVFKVVPVAGESELGTVTNTVV